MFVEKAREHLAIAKALIEEIGYGRRKPEAEELEKQMHSMNFFNEQKETFSS